mgnify:CR=1 FL=1|nr:MAG TPA: hypothetical protein [Caudoviricetes sp.]
MTLREAIREYEGFPAKETFDFPVESIVPYIMGIASNYQRTENGQTFTVKCRYSVNTFSDNLGYVCFVQGMPGRLYKAKIDVVAELDDENMIDVYENGRFVVTDYVTDKLQIEKIEVGPISLVAAFDGEEIIEGVREWTNT